MKVSGSNWSPDSSASSRVAVGFLWFDATLGDLGSRRWVVKDQEFLSLTPGPDNTCERPWFAVSIKSVRHGWHGIS